MGTLGTNADVPRSLLILACQEVLLDRFAGPAGLETQLGN
jgi:hypothetical protein